MQLAAVPTDATAAVVCDNSFTLFVNGHKVGSGSEFKTPFLFDLRPLLKRGENLFAVDAVNHLPDNSLPTPETAVPGTENPAGLSSRVRLGRMWNHRNWDISFVARPRGYPGDRGADLPDCTRRANRRVTADKG